MNSTNAQIKFRCSSIGDLMSSGRGATKQDKIAKKKVDIDDLLQKIAADVEAGKTHLKTSAARVEKLELLKLELYQLENTPEDLEDMLGDTAKSKCRAIMLEDIYGALEEVESDATRHGKEFEPAAIMQYGEQMGLNPSGTHAQFRKNIQRKTLQLGTAQSPHFLTGEPDVVFGGRIWEFKCPFSIPSFYDQVLKPKLDYILQVQGYMLLFDLEKATILTSLFRNKNIKSDKVFENTPRALRFHAYEVDRDEDCIQAIKNRLDLCAEYVRKCQLEFKSQKGFRLYKEYKQLYLF